MIQPRKYQESAISSLPISGKAVLSICPGGGKTFTAIVYSERNKQFNRILILAHGTNVLKSQWNEEFDKLGIKYSNDVDSGERYTIAIPQALKKKKLNKYDLVIIDEAHEFYFTSNKSEEGMLKNILKKTNPTMTLFLTGTPSKFIKNGFTPVIVSGCDIYNDPQGKEYLCNTYIGMIKSSYKLDNGDYNDEGETSSFEFTNKDTQASLEALVEEMLNRLSCNSFTATRPNVANILSHTRLNKFQQAFGGLGKTLIAARDIAHGKVLEKALRKKKVKVLLSDSESDVDSVNIDTFKKDTETQVLIVIRRGILGFNMPTLINVVDFTMSRNIDRIYQLYARVLRVHPQGKSKFYFRMCSSINPLIDSIYTQAALCLNNPSFISKYNGKNLKQLEMIQAKERTKKPKEDAEEGELSATPKGKKSKQHIIDGDMLNQVIDLNLMTELIVNSNSKYWKEFEYTTIGVALSKLTGVEFRIDWSDLEGVVRHLEATGIMQ